MSKEIKSFRSSILIDETNLKNINSLQHQVFQFKIPSEETIYKIPLDWIPYMGSTFQFLFKHFISNQSEKYILLPDNFNTKIPQLIVFIKWVKGLLDFVEEQKIKSVLDLFDYLPTQPKATQFEPILKKWINTHFNSFNQKQQQVLQAQFQFYNFVNLLEHTFFLEWIGWYLAQTYFLKATSVDEIRELFQIKDSGYQNQKLYEDLKKSSAWIQLLQKKNTNKPKIPSPINIHKKIQQPPPPKQLQQKVEPQKEILVQPLLPKLPQVQQQQPLATRKVQMY